MSLRLANPFYIKTFSKQEILKVVSILSKRVELLKIERQSKIYIIYFRYSDDSLAIRSYINNSLDYPIGVIGKDNETILGYVL